MSQICSSMVNFIFLANFGGHFCYHGKVKVKLISDFNTWAIILINLLEEFGEKQFLAS